MKKHLSSPGLWVLLFVVIALVVGCFSRTSTSNSEPAATTEVAPASEAESNDVAIVENVADTKPAEADPIDASMGENLLYANYHSVSQEQLVPASLKLTPGAGEVVKLVTGGLDESVILTFVTNYYGTFTLGPDEIIYLTDLGLSDSLIKAMLLHDHDSAGDWTAAPALISTDVSTTVASTPSYQNSASVTMDSGVAAISTGGWSGAPMEESAPPDQDAGVAYYDALTPYGNWVDLDGYGRCWQPTVALRNRNWQPYYTSGRWIDSDCGWYWSSDYSWGWAPFHYGRWVHHATLNWCWVPDRVWGPSWVLWRSTGTYCGWAPLPPAAHYTVASGFTYRGQPVPPTYHFNVAATSFHFVPITQFRDPNLPRIAMPRPQVNGIFNHTVVTTGVRVQNDQVVNAGPVGNLSGAAGRPGSRTVALRPMKTPLPFGHRERVEQNGNSLAVFRPTTVANMPSRVMDTPNHTALTPGSNRQPALQPPLPNMGGFATAIANPAAPRPNRVSYVTSLNRPARTATAPSLPVNNGSRTVQNYGGNPGSFSNPASDTSVQQVPRNSLVAKAVAGASRLTFITNRPGLNNPQATIWHHLSNNPRRNMSVVKMLMAGQQTHRPRIRQLNPGGRQPAKPPQKTLGKTRPV